jgi:hypothetical protein
MLCVIMLSVIMLRVIMLSVIMLSVIMLSVIILKVAGTYSYYCINNHGKIFIVKTHKPVLKNVCGRNFIT